MAFEEEQNTVPGCVPEFGAIFMSNSITKEECFQRKLLGLPSGLAHFVKQVRAGMFLFLFQFERRELHGVYQASSDGAMNIVPHAFSSTGKQFPAQVKFTPLWLCTPLSENEFSMAIKENYYSTKKFHFGLSEDQVRKLLYLFSVRKLKPQRFFTGQKVDRDCASKFSRAAVDGRSITSHRAEDNPDADSSHGSILSNDYFGGHLGNGGRTIEDLRFPISGMDRKHLPYDPDAFGIDSSYSSSYECNFNPLQNCAPPHYSNAENVFPLSENQSFLPYVELRSTMRCQDFSSGLGCCVPMASPNHYENSQRTSMPVLEAAYSENMNTNSSENVGYRGFSLPRPSLGPVPFSENGQSDSMNVGTSYSFSPSHYPSFVFDYGSCKASEDTIDQRMRQGGLNGAIANNVAMLKMGKPQLQGCGCVDHHDNSSLKPDICKNFGGLYSDIQKNKKSVFSRLALAPKAHIKENETFVDDDEDDMDGSVDELMSMLQQSHYQWFKMRKSRQLIKGDATIYRKRKQTTFNSKLLEDDLKEISDEGRMDDIPSSEDNGNKFAGKMSFLDFKRRSELRKNHDGVTKIGCSSGSAESEGGLHKKRKLIRPDFSKNCNLVVPQLSVETRGPPSVSCEDSSSAVEGLTTRDSTLDGSSQDLNNTDVKESSQNVGIETVVCSIPCYGRSCIAVEGLVSKDSLVNELSQDPGNSTRTFEQDSLLEACKSSSNGIASGEIECSRSMQQSCQNADFDGEVALNMASELGNEMASVEVVVSGGRGCEMDVQQTVDTENGVNSGSVKSSQGIASQSQATIIT